MQKKRPAGYGLFFSSDEDEMEDVQLSPPQQPTSVVIKRTTTTTSNTTSSAPINRPRRQEAIDGAVYSSGRKTLVIEKKKRHTQGKSKGSFVYPKALDNSRLLHIG